MRIFGRKQREVKHNGKDVVCTHCGSSNTRPVYYHDAGIPNYIKVWRGQRSLTYRCYDCGCNSYVAIPKQSKPEEISEEDPMVDDEDALREAEEKLKKQIDEDNDRLFR